MRPIYDTDLIKQINKHLIGVDPETHESLISTKDIARIIMETPTANIEQKQGQWTIVNSCLGRSDEFECSVCGRRVYLSALMKYCDYEYCPNCGTKIEGGETDD